MIADPAIEAAARALCRLHNYRPVCSMCPTDGTAPDYGCTGRKYRSDAPAAISAYLAALPSDREAAEEFRNWLLIEHANHFVANCDDLIVTKMLAAITAAREAGAKEERETCAGIAEGQVHAEKVLGHLTSKSLHRHGQHIAATIETAIRARGEP